jgi:hypothetical protein
VIAALIVALAAGAWAAAPSTTSGANANKAAARSESAALLARLTLPAGAQSSATEPSGDGAALANPAERPATPNLVDDHGWWIVPGGPNAVLAFIAQHPPSGSKLDQAGSSNIAPGYRDVGYSWPARAGVLSTRELVVEVVALKGGSTALRADALVVWIAPRPASERIARGVDRLQVKVVNGKRTTQGPLTFTNSGQVSRVRALIDRLPLGQPGAVACPADFAIRVRLAFYSTRSARPVAVADVDPNGYEGVRLTIKGRSQPPLTSAAFPGSGRVHVPSLITQLDRILGVALNVAPSP